MKNNIIHPFKTVEEYFLSNPKNKIALAVLVCEHLLISGYIKNSNTYYTILHEIIGNYYEKE